MFETEVFEINSDEVKKHICGQLLGVLLRGAVAYDHYSDEFKQWSKLADCKDLNTGIYQVNP